MNEHRAETAAEACVGTEFGKIAAGLSTHQLDTEFQAGLRLAAHFSTRRRLGEPSSRR